MTQEPQDDASSPAVGWRGTPPDRAQQVISPEQVDALVRLGLPAGETVARALAPALQVLSAAAERVGRQVAEAVAALHSPATRAALHRCAQALGPVLEAWARLEREAFPNWPNALAYVWLRQVALDAGVPVAWVPREDVLLDLADAVDDDARYAVLLDRADDVLADCGRALEQVTDATLKDLKDLLAQAVACCREHPAPAQALCLTTVPSLASRVLAEQGGFRRLAVRLGRAASRPGLPPEGQMRDTLALLPVGGTLESFWPDKGDPVPTRPNRHAVAHGLGGEQYSDLNALVSVMLAVSLLRQLQDQLDRSARSPSRSALSPVGRTS